MSDLDFKTIGLKIRERRKSLGITQEFIAERLDVNPSHISNIERGRANPSLTALVKIANILRCSVDFFLCEEYTYERKRKKNESMDDQIIKKLQYCSEKTKKQILQIIDILCADEKEK
jgi:transcriptional regulator with XRE-family HTH domain